MQIERKHIHLARVLFEDDDFVTLEIAKDENRELRIEENDRFWTLTFINAAKRKIWTPWKDNA